MWQSSASLSTIIFVLQLGAAVLGVLIVLLAIRRAELQRAETLAKDQVIAKANENAEQAVLGQRQLILKTEEMRSVNLGLSLKVEEERTGRLELERQVRDLQELDATGEAATAGSRTAYEKLVLLSGGALAVSDAAKLKVSFVRHSFSDVMQPARLTGQGLRTMFSITVGDEKRRSRAEDISTAGLFELLGISERAALRHLTACISERPRE